MYLYVCQYAKVVFKGQKAQKLQKQLFSEKRYIKRDGEFAIYRVYVTVAILFRLINIAHRSFSRIFARYKTRSMHVYVRASVYFTVHAFRRSQRFLPAHSPSKSSLRKLVKANFSDPSRCPSPKG